MYNSLVLINGQNIWISIDEAKTISDYLLTNPTGAQAFVNIPRLQKTYNLAQIASVGISAIFSDPMVKGGDFKFSYDGLWAKNGDKEYVWNKGWKLQRGSWDGSGMTFDDYIASTIIQ